MYLFLVVLIIILIIAIIFKLLEILLIPLLLISIVYYLYRNFFARPKVTVVYTKKTNNVQDDDIIDVEYEEVVED